MDTVNVNGVQINIIYEDADAIVFVKPYGMLSQRAEGSDEKSVLEYISEYLHGEEVFPVHRLDRTTGGVMIAAKTRGAAAALSTVIASDGMKKTYLAAVHGVPAGGILDDVLFFDRRKSKSFVIKKGTTRKGAKRALLEYERISTSTCAAGEVSLVRVRLMTGRTHQIRVQMANAGHPLLGDGKYGGRDNRCRCALWSHEIAFEHGALADVCLKKGAFRQALEQGVSLRADPPNEYPWNIF